MSSINFTDEVNNESSVEQTYVCATEVLTILKEVVIMNSLYKVTGIVKMISFSVGKYKY